VQQKMVGVGTAGWSKNHVCVIDCNKR